MLSPIVVAGLGLFGLDSNGLTNTHAVGLWTGDDATLLASTTVTNASSAPVRSTEDEGRWLFNAITPDGKRT